MPKRDLKHGRSSYAKRVRTMRGMVAAARIGYKVARQFLRTKTGSEEEEGPSGAITSQHDSKMLYRRRRAPRRIRRKMYRKYKSFLGRQLKAVQDNTNLFQGSGTRSSSPNGQGMFSIVSGYLKAGSGSVDGIGDLHDFFNNITQAIPENTSLKWFLTGISTDYTIVNATAGGTVELDVYEWVCRRDCNLKDEVNLADYLEAVIGEETLLPGTSNRITTQSLGYVPTDSNEAMRYIVIKSKQRFYLGQNQAISFTRRVKFFRPKVISSEDLNYANSGAVSFMKAGVSRGILVIQKGLPSATNASADPTTVRFNAQTRYRCKYINQNPNASGLGYT